MFHLQNILIYIYILSLWQIEIYSPSKSLNEVNLNVLPLDKAVSMSAGWPGWPGPGTCPQWACPELPWTAVTESRWMMRCPVKTRSNDRLMSVPDSPQFLPHPNNHLDSLHTGPGQDQATQIQMSRKHLRSNQLDWLDIHVRTQIYGSLIHVQYWCDQLNTSQMFVSRGGGVIKTIRTRSRGVGQCQQGRRTPGSASGS